MNDFRMLIMDDFIFSSSFDKTSKAWLFDTSDIQDGQEEEACIRTFKVRRRRERRRLASGPSRLGGGGLHQDIQG